MPLALGPELEVFLAPGLELGVLLEVWVAPGRELGVFLAPAFGEGVLGVTVGGTEVGDCP